MASNRTIVLGNPRRGKAKKKRRRVGARRGPGGRFLPKKKRRSPKMARTKRRRKAGARRRRSTRSRARPAARRRRRKAARAAAPRRRRRRSTSRRASPRRRRRTGARRRSSRRRRPTRFRSYKSLRRKFGAKKARAKWRRKKYVRSNGLGGLLPSMSDFKGVLKTGVAVTVGFAGVNAGLMLLDKFVLDKALATQSPKVRSAVNFGVRLLLTPVVAKLASRFFGMDGKAVAAGGAAATFIHGIKDVIAMNPTAVPAGAAQAFAGYDGSGIGAYLNTDNTGYNLGAYLNTRNVGYDDGGGSLMGALPYDIDSDSLYE